MLSEMSNRGRQTLYDLKLYVKSEKKKLNSYKQKTDWQLPGEEGGESEKWVKSG